MNKHSDSRTHTAEIARGIDTCMKTDLSVTIKIGCAAANPRLLRGKPL